MQMNSYWRVAYVAKIKWNFSCRNQNGLEYKYNKIGYGEKKEYKNRNKLIKNTIYMKLSQELIGDNEK